MFGIGFPELLFVLLLAILILGPEHMPKAAQLLGKWSAKMRSAATSLNQAVAEDETLREIHQQVTIVRNDIAQTTSGLLEHVGDTHQSLQEARAELRALGRSPDSAPQPQPDKTGDLPDTAPAACVETAPSEFMDKPLHWFEDSNDAVSSVKNAGLRVIRLKPRILLPGPVSRLVCRETIRLDKARPSQTLHHASEHLAKPGLQVFCKLRRLDPVCGADPACLRIIRLIRSK